MKLKNTLVVNLFGGPGAGKSTMAADLFAKLKISGVECELVTEFAKDLVWRESWKTFDDQLFVFANQHHRLKMVSGKVDVIVTDSPLICAIPYSKKEGGLFSQLVIERFNSFNNLNFFIKRNSDHFSEIGRKHSLEESKMIDEEIEGLLKQNNIHYRIVNNGLGEPIREMYFEIVGRTGGRIPKEMLPGLIGLYQGIAESSGEFILPDLKGQFIGENK